MGTQVLAALMAANGWLVTPISWSLIGFIWVYNLVWMVVIDSLKVGFHRIFGQRELGLLRWQRKLHAPLDPYGGLHSR